MSRPDTESASRRSRGALTFAEPPVARTSPPVGDRGRPSAGRGVPFRAARWISGGRWMAPLAVLLVVIPPLFLIVPLVTHHGVFSNWGDGAATELSVQNAARLRQTVGPYDRFGWNHPGPASFYLLAIPYVVMGWNGAGLPVGAGLVNLAAGAALVVLIARRAGGQAALGVAGLLCAFESVLSAPNFTNVWNPVLVVVPTALFLVLCADLAAGNIPSLIGAVAVGSFVVQTHLGTSAAVGVALLLALGVRLATWQRAGTLGSSARKAAPVVAAALAVGAVEWAPPLWQQITGHPGNITEVVRFFLHGHGHHSLSDAFSALANGMLGAHLGTHLGVDVGLIHRHDAGLAIVLVAMVGIASACWYRRQWLGLALAAGALPVAGAFFVSLLRVQDAIAGYLVVWTGALTLAAGMALVLCVTAPAPDAPRLAGRGNRRRRLVGAVVLVAAAGGLSFRLAGQADRFRQGGGYANVTQASLAVERLLPADAHRVLVCVSSADAWPTAAGVVANLTKDGRDARVEAHWLYVFGRQLVPSGREVAAVFLESISRPPPAVAVSPLSSSAGGDLNVRVFVPARGGVSASLCPEVS